MEHAKITYDMTLDEMSRALGHNSRSSGLRGNAGNFILSGYEMRLVREHLSQLKGEVLMPTLYMPPDEVYERQLSLVPSGFRAANIAELMLYGASTPVHGWHPIVALGSPLDYPPEICPSGSNGSLYYWAYARYPRSMIDRGYRLAVVPR